MLHNDVIRISLGNDLPLKVRLCTFDGKSRYDIDPTLLTQYSVWIGKRKLTDATEISSKTLTDNYLRFTIPTENLNKIGGYTLWITGLYNGKDISLSYENKIEVVQFGDASSLEHCMPIMPEHDHEPHHHHHGPMPEPLPERCVLEFDGVIIPVEYSDAQIAALKSKYQSMYEGAQTATALATAAAKAADDAVEEMEKDVEDFLDTADTKITEKLDEVSGVRDQLVALESTVNTNEANRNSQVDTLKNQYAAATKSLTDEIKASKDQTSASEAAAGYAKEMADKADASAQEADAAKSRANGAAASAEKVNATLNGTKLTVTNRYGEKTTVDTKGEKGAKGDDADIAGAEAAKNAASAAATSATNAATAANAAATRIENIENKVVHTAGEQIPHSDFVKVGTVIAEAQTATSSANNAASAANTAAAAANTAAAAAQEYAESYAEIEERMQTAEGNVEEIQTELAGKQDKLNTYTEVHDTGGRLYLVGYTDKMACINLARTYVASSLSAAKAFVEAASPSTPQLIGTYNTSAALAEMKAAWDAVGTTTTQTIESADYIAKISSPLYVQNKKAATIDQIPDVSGKADKTDLGNLDDLDVAANSIVAAVNTLKGEIDVLDDNIGSLDELTTEEKNSLVGAANELKEKIDDKADNSRVNGIDTLLGQTVEGLSDLEGAVGSTAELETEETDTIVGAINEVNGKVEDCSSEITAFLKVDSVKDNGNIVLTDKSGNKREYMAATPSGDPLHYAYVDGGAVWNATTGFWELNGLTDITNEQMRPIYRAYCIGITDKGYTGDDVTINALALPRTNLNYPNYLRASEIPLYNTFRENRTIEIVRFFKYPSGKPFVVSSNAGLSGSFNNCQILKRVDTILKVNSVGSNAIWNPFGNCFLLEYVKLSGLKVSISFANSPNLTAECVAYMINNAQSATITITLHATAYARAMADADVQAALAAKTNVSLAEA